MSGLLLHTLLFTIAVALFSTLLILPFGTGLAWWLSRYQGPGKSILETLIALPIVMPPRGSNWYRLPIVKPAMLARVVELDGTEHERATHR